jgi:predicted aldo/keto reductase-like oxidoreductase
MMGTHRRTLETSLSNLDTHVDLLGIHGINRPDQLEWTLREGGCMDVAREYQR